MFMCAPYVVWGIHEEYLYVDVSRSHMGYSSVHAASILIFMSGDTWW